MSLDKPIGDATALIASSLVVLVGTAALWTNPKRILNRLFFSISIHVSLWLVFLYIALTARAGLPWLRGCCAIAGLLPLHLLFLRESVIGVKGTRLLRGACTWIVGGVVMFVIPLTSLFVPEHSSEQVKVYGFGYYVFVGLQLCSYGELFRGSVVKAKGLMGIAKIELKILLLGGSITGGLILGLMIVGVFTGARALIHLQPLVVVIFYSLTVLAITTHRIFEPTYLLHIVLRQIFLIVSMSAIVYFLDRVVADAIGGPLGYVIAGSVVLVIAKRLENSLSVIFNSKIHFTRVLNEIQECAGSGYQLRELVARYEANLGQYLNASSVKIGVTESHSDFEQEAVALSIVEVDAIRKMKWVTPERLMRERMTSHGRALGDLLRNREIYALIYQGGGTLDILVALGKRESNSPYVYQEIEQIVVIARAIEAALSRIYLTEKAQKAERLAAAGILGAGIAHEIRNPLVSIKSFIQLLPDHYLDVRFRQRFFPLISSEVARIEGLTEQLLNLAAPRKPEKAIYSLRVLISDSLPLIQCKAEESGVRVLVRLCQDGDQVDIDANSFRQVLINLCLNAIQAQESQVARERWIEIGTELGPNCIYLIVRDNGPGIQLSERHRLFEVFHTTKSRGFGLGLALSNGILSGQGAKLNLDPYIEGQGASFRVLFPCKESL